MQVTEVRLNKTDGKDNQLAYGSITLDGDFIVAGIRVITSKDGNLFVAFPSRKSLNGEYKDVCYPITKELREEVNMKVLAKYEEL